MIDLKFWSFIASIYQIGEQPGKIIREIKMKKKTLTT
jgi:hypothetical protein